MKVALIGTEQAIVLIQSIITPENIFEEILPFPCSSEETGKIVSRVQREVDGILFTGYFPFAYACRDTVATVPWAYAKRTVNSALDALIQAAVCGTDISKITYDLTESIEEQMSNILCADVGLIQGQFRLYRFVGSDYFISEEEYIRRAASFHLGNLASGRATLCLSGMYDVVEQLKQEGYPAFWVKPTMDTLNRSVNELSLRHQLRLNQEKMSSYQSAVVAMKVRFQSPAGHREGYDYLCLRRNHMLENCVYNFAQSICAAVEQNLNGSCYIYTTAYELGAVTDSFSFLGLLEDLQQLPGVESVMIGIGLGRSPGIAKVNAEYGVTASEKRGCSCYYIVMDDENIAGPFWASERKQRGQIGGSWRQIASQETGVGITILETLARVHAQFGFDTVTPGDLARMCEMTRSNMNRVLSKLEAKGYVQTVGFQPLNGAGRPRRLIRLMFNTGE